MTTTMLAAEGGQKNFLVPNGTFFVCLIIFLIVLFVIGKFVVPPIRDALQQRADMVAKTTEDNNKAAEAFEDADKTYRNELTEARTEAGKIRDEARGEGQRILDDMRAEARAESDSIQRRAADELQQQADRIGDDLRGGVRPLSVQLADRVLGVGTANSRRG